MSYNEVLYICDLFWKKIQEIGIKYLAVFLCECIAKLAERFAVEGCRDQNNCPSTNTYSLARVVFKTGKKSPSEYINQFQNTLTNKGRLQKIT